jgi:hypothetical protein
MRPLLLFTILFVCTEFSFAQKDTIPTIFLERSNFLGKTVTKKIATWKAFKIYTKEPIPRTFKVLTLKDINDTSMIVITAQSNASYNRSRSYYYDTIPFKDIQFIRAKTKYYVLKRFLGYGLIGVGGLFLGGYMLSGGPLPPGYEFYPLGALGVLSGIQLIQSHKFNTHDKWNIKGSYYLQ